MACYRFGGYQGALLGLALVPALVVVPAAFVLVATRQYSAERAVPALGQRPGWGNYRNLP